MVNSCRRVCSLRVGQLISDIDKYQSWLALFATFGYASSFGVYQDLYTRAGTSSSSNISWIGSSQLFFFIAMGLPAGKLLDKGYFRQVVLLGSIIYVFSYVAPCPHNRMATWRDRHFSSMFMLSLAHINRYYQLFLSQGVGMGIGTGLIYLPSMAVQAHHWKERRALAMGIVITGKSPLPHMLVIISFIIPKGSSIGGIIYPIMLNHLFHNSVGFAWGVRASAFLTLGFLVAANCLMSDRLPSTNGDLNSEKHRASEIMTDWPFLLAIAGYIWSSTRDACTSEEFT